MQNYVESVNGEYKNDDTTTDFWTGQLCQTLREKENIFHDERDLAIGIADKPFVLTIAFSSDGVQLVKIGTHSVWAMMVINLNLPLTLRYKKRNLLCLGFVPWPSEPSDLTTFVALFV